MGAVIFVVGAPRSGTTLTMSVLQACGAQLGPVNSLNEIPALRDGLIKPFLKSIGADPRGQWPLPDPEWPVPPPGWREAVLAALRGATAAKIIKGGLTPRVWAETFPEAHYLFAYRDPVKVAQSCMRTGFMDAYKAEQDWADYARVYQERAERLIASCGGYKLDTQELMRGGTEGWERTMEAIGLTWNPARVQAVLRPSRWHG